MNGDYRNRGKGVNWEIIVIAITVIAFWGTFIWNLAS